jgi:hypothetical protein
MYSGVVPNYHHCHYCDYIYCDNGNWFVFLSKFNDEHTSYTKEQFERYLRLKAFQ